MSTGPPPSWWSRRRRSVPRRPYRPWTWRTTNLALFGVLALAFVSGAAAQATGSQGGAWVAVGHGVVGLVVIALVPRKSRVVAAGMRRRRPSRWTSVGLAALTLGTLTAGIGSATGLLSTVAGVEPLWVHIALALLLLPLLAWHVVVRPVRPRATDLGRRTLVRAGLLAAGGSALYAGLERVVRLADLPGAQRRFTGSHAVDAAATPVTSWLDDAVPDVRGRDWRLTVVDAVGTRNLSLDDLVASGTTTVRATLDCTSGWHATQTWTGVPVAQLLTGDEYPARLVAPGRRGFWWVKWVAGVELSRRPWWLQPPFPLA